MTPHECGLSIAYTWQSCQRNFLIHTKLRTQCWWHEATTIYFGRLKIIGFPFLTFRKKKQMSGASSFSQKGERVRKLDLMGGTEVKAIQWLQSLADVTLRGSKKEKEKEKDQHWWNIDVNFSLLAVFCVTCAIKFFNLCQIKKLEVVGLVLFMIPKSRD